MSIPFSLTGGVLGADRKHPSLEVANFRYMVNTSYKNNATIGSTTNRKTTHGGKKFYNAKATNKFPKRPCHVSAHQGDGEHGDIAQNWKTLMGQDRWETLLDPVDIQLRRLIIHYGEMAQATYDTFIQDNYSKFAGSSRFTKENFMTKVGLGKGHSYKYRVTKFIYATSSITVPEAFIIKPVSREAWSKESNFMGYVAVADDESTVLLGRREIVVAWRGTSESCEWDNDFEFLQVSASQIFGDDEIEPMIHRGFLSIYTSDDPKSPFNKTSARHQVITEIKRLVHKFKNEEISITVTGHSLGAALATLNAADIVANNVEGTLHGIPSLVTAVVFGSPKVGDANFKKKLCQYHNLGVLRVRNANDIIPTCPPFVEYHEVGEELKIDTSKSSYLKKPDSILNWHPWHNLEAYMHGVAGTQGSKGGFNLEVNRDLALLNKGSDLLKEEYCVPVSWWVLRNKGMVQQVDGTWLLMDHENEHDEKY